MAIGKITATLAGHDVWTDWLEFDINVPRSFSIHASGKYRGKLTLRLRTRETGATADKKRYKSGQQIAEIEQLVSKHDVCIGFRHGDYKSGAVDLALQAEGN